MTSHIVLYATMEPLMAYETIIGLRLFTNNLFMIAKCTHVTPDPVQPDHQYLRVHYIGPLCLVSHVPSLHQHHSSKLLPSSCQCYSLLRPLPLLCHLLRPSHA